MRVHGYDGFLVLVVLGVVVAVFGFWLFCWVLYGLYNMVQCFWAVWV